MIQLMRGIIDESKNGFLLSYQYGFSFSGVGRISPIPIHQHCLADEARAAKLLFELMMGQFIEDTVNTLKIGLYI